MRSKKRLIPFILGGLLSCYFISSNEELSQELSSKKESISQIAPEKAISLNEAQELPLKKSKKKNELDEVILSLKKSEFHKRELKKEDSHHASGLIIKMARLIGKVRRLGKSSKHLRQIENNFYKNCSYTEHYPTAIRAVCLSYANKNGYFFNTSQISPRIERLAAQLNDEA